MQEGNLGKLLWKSSAHTAALGIEPELCGLYFTGEEPLCHLYPLLNVTFQSETAVKSAPTKCLVLVTVLKNIELKSAITGSTAP